MRLKLWNIRKKTAIQGVIFLINIPVSIDAVIDLATENRSLHIFQAIILDSCDLSKSISSKNVKEIAETFTQSEIT